jgi:hypothetical protein
MRESKKKIAYKTVKEEFFAGKSENDVIASHFTYTPAVEN